MSYRQYRQRARDRHRSGMRRRMRLRTTRKNGLLSQQADDIRPELMDAILEVAENLKKSVEKIEPKEEEE